MRFHRAEAPLALLAGSLVVAGMAWGQSSVKPAIWPETPPWALGDMPQGKADTARDVGDRSGGPASCRPVYSKNARFIHSGLGEPEKGDYGFALVRMECPALR
ncbi:hypothetical protein E0493_11955 [Roseomonas sp. M0104]|uniref:Uncharacterized protein n=1 Tax=Teichococcus coralli TaxID=2545983 RepID=A0A845BBP2_9PROT|nr:hypothetical protein [Pseudoroseomonas coralli]MXP64058.1 hypothetical protein [Pseudoroseomonas coralli]